MDKTFFNRSATEVARELVGKTIIVGERAGIIAETEAYCGERDLACHARFGRTKRSEILYRAPGTVYVYLCYGMHWMLNVITDSINKPSAVLVRGIIVTNKSQIRSTKSDARKKSKFSNIQKLNLLSNFDVRISYLVKKGSLHYSRDDSNRQSAAGYRPILGPGRVTKYLGIDGEFNGKMVKERLALTSFTSEESYPPVGGEPPPRCRASRYIKIADGIKIAKCDIVAGPRIGINFAPEPWRSKNWRFNIQLRDR